jgi:hypothetical protein
MRIHPMDGIEDQDAVSRPGINKPVNAKSGLKDDILFVELINGGIQCQ